MVHHSYGMLCSSICLLISLTCAVEHIIHSLFGSSLQAVMTRYLLDYAAPVIHPCSSLAT